MPGRKPQLSPAMTVLKSSRLAFITEDVARMHCLNWFRVGVPFQPTKKKLVPETHVLGPFCMKSCAMSREQYGKGITEWISDANQKNRGQRRRPNTRVIWLIWEPVYLFLLPARNRAIPLKRFDQAAGSHQRCRCPNPALESKDSWARLSGNFGPYCPNGG